MVFHARQNGLLRRQTPFWSKINAGRPVRQNPDGILLLGINAHKAAVPAVFSLFRPAFQLREGNDSPVEGDRPQRHIKLGPGRVVIGVDEEGA